MGWGHRIALAGVLAAIFAAGALRHLGRDEAPPPVAAAACPDPVAVVSADGSQRVVCRSEAPAQAGRAWRGAGCSAPFEAGRLPPLRPGDAVRLTTGPEGCAWAAAPLPASSRLALGVPLDLNEASAADLEHLPGIGPGRARAIVRDREARGPFASPGDLARVPGIGPATVRALEGRISAGR